VKFLGESNPSSRESTDSSKAPRLKYPYPKSIRFSFTDMSRGTARRYLGPDYKGAPEPLIPDISDKSQFERILSVVIRQGEPARYSLPSLPGREYSADDIDYVAMILIAAEKRLLHFNGQIDGEMKVPLIERLKENRPFREAVEEGDVGKELSIALHELDIGKRAAQLSARQPDLGLEVVRACAMEDVSMCSAIARQHIHGGTESPPPEVEIGARLLDITLRGASISTLPVFDLAMSLLNEINWITAHAQKTGSVDQAFADFKAAQNVALRADLLSSMDPDSIVDAKDSYINTRMGELLPQMDELGAAFVVAGELRLLEQHLGESMEPGVPKSQWETRALSEMYAALKTADEYEAETRDTEKEIDIAEVENPLVARMLQIKFANPSEEISNLELALQAVCDAKAEQKKKEEKAREQRRFALPWMYDHNFEQGLEEILPPNDDQAPDEYNERAECIRETSRTISFHVRAKVPFLLVPEPYRHAVASLRGDYSPEGVLRLATELSDMSLGKVPLDPKIRSEVPARLGEEDFESSLSMLKPAQEALLRSHYSESTTSLETLENILVLMGEPNAILRNNVLGAWRDGVQTTQRIFGTYSNNTGVISSFEDAEIPDEHLYDTSEFEFLFESASGRVTLVKGWENLQLREIDGMQIAPAMPSLVFPLPNLGINMELEDALNNSFPRKIAGKESKRNVQIRMLARTLVLYAGLNSDNEEASNKLAELIERKTGQLVSSAVPEIYEDAVSSIQKVYSIENIISVTVALVNEFGEPIEKPTDLPVPATPVQEKKDGKSKEEVFAELMIHEKELISRVLGVSGCTPDTLGEFLEMDAGTRELRMRNLISSMWTQGDFSKDIERLRTAKESIYRTCALKEPNENQKRIAAADISELTDSQKALVATFSNVALSDLTKEHVLTFGMWLRADQQELQAYWDRNYPSIDAVTRLMMGLSMRKQSYNAEEAALIRRIRGKGEDEKLVKEDFDIQHYASYQQSLRAYSNYLFGTPREERLNFWKRGMVNLITAAELSHRVRYSGDLSLKDGDKRLLSIAFGKDASELTGDDVVAMDGAFMNKAYNDDRDHKRYYPQILRLARHGDSVKLRSLYFAAQRQSEFNTLAEFLGCPISEPNVSVHTSNGMSVPKIRKGKYHKTNDDCFSSAVVRTMAGEIRLHGVFDGMGGHASGDVASNIARTVFEIYAVAGWMRSPEDARKALILADIVIATEAVSRKTRNDDYQEQQCNMGTTAVITMQKGRELFVVHCGDSPAKVLRDGQTAHDTDEHNYAFELRAQGVQFDPAMIPNNIVVAALGASTKYISINNGINSKHAPFILQDGDILMLASDGITDVIDDSEIHYIIDAYGGDLDEVRRQLIALAEARDGVGPFKSIVPGSTLEITGKGSDDKTIIMERIRGLGQ
jgi:serine/threonine protein phosphatase PrpC